MLDGYQVVRWEADWPVRYKIDRAYPYQERPYHDRRDRSYSVTLLHPDRDLDSYLCIEYNEHEDSIRIRGSLIELPIAILLRDYLTDCGFRVVAFSVGPN